MPNTLANQEGLATGSLRDEYFSQEMLVVGIAIGFLKQECLGFRQAVLADRYGWTPADKFCFCGVLVLAK